MWGNCEMVPQPGPMGHDPSHLHYGQTLHNYKNKFNVLLVISTNIYIIVPEYKLSKWNNSSSIVLLKLTI